MFSCEILQIFNNTFFTEHLRWLLLGGVCEGTSLVKILQSCHFNIFAISHRCFRKCPLREVMNNRDCLNVYRYSCLIFHLPNFLMALIKCWKQPFIAEQEKYLFCKVAKVNFFTITLENTCGK